ncbi:MAG TPA: hypothetical protein VN229_13235 [Terriglobales bacterium]|nr:hypothetical protein [Terriglobales bacterium]
MSQSDTSPLNFATPESAEPQASLHENVLRQKLRPEQISLQGIPRMGVVLREIGLCVAVALGLALLASIYVHFKG